jgi:hypothetical protein
MLTLDLHVPGCVVHQVKAISLHAPTFSNSRQEMSSSQPDFRWYQDSEVYSELRVFSYFQLRHNRLRCCWRYT